MTSPAPQTTPSAEATFTELAPSYAIPLVLAAGAGALALIQPWVGLAITLFTLFLSWQTFTLRLRFTETALDVYRNGSLIRHFPYAEWQVWQIFWPPVPVLFYFREVNSIHFLPIIFDPQQLEACLRRHCPDQAIDPAPEG